MLDSIFEQRGTKSWIIENNKRFLDVWKETDPGIFEVEDAKNRLALLQKQ